MNKSIALLLIILVTLVGQALAKKIEIINNASAFNINLMVTGRGKPAYKETVSTGRRVAKIPSFKAEAMTIEVVDMNDKIQNSVTIDSSKTVNSIELSQAPAGNYTFYPQLRVTLAPKNS
jgi:hypothetical protein